MAFSFIHTGDLHLDSPLSGLSRLNDARTTKIASAPRRAFAALVDMAIERKVDVFLIAGDLWDGTWRDVSAGLFVQEQAGRLKAAGIGVFAVLGNHDAQSLVSAQIRNIDAIHLFGSDRPSSIQWGEAMIHGMSYPEREVSENLALTYPQAVPGCINIGLLHTSLDGRPGHAPYAPCEPAHLLAKGYHYFALGHVHSFEVVHDAAAVAGGTIAYCGVLQGRHVGETGQKGAVYGIIEDGKASVSQLPLSFLTWYREEADLGEGAAPADAMKAALESIAERATADLSVVRLVLTGETPSHFSLQTRRQSLLEEAQFIATGLAGDRLFLERVELATTPPSGPAPPLPSQFETFLERAARDPDMAEAAGAEIAEILSSVGPEVRREIAAAMPELTPFEAAGDPRELLEQALARVTARLADHRP
ncbi:MAG: DNA repair exonuclease [Pseudomonadota bacterium]